jgi:hypothetical protein
VAAISTTGIAALSTSQVVALTTAGVTALTTLQVAALTTSQVAALTTTQADAFSEAQYAVFTTTQIAAITTTQISHFILSTPIILDLDGNGVNTVGRDAGVNFDLFADGQSVNAGWVSSGDGLLVMDRNGDGAINDGSELFGSSTTLASGQKAADGYVALRELDSNADGVISSDDALFAELRVWVDSNTDGVSTEGELKTLTSLGITRINTQATADISLDNGNVIGLTSSYETSDGVTHEAADVWFATDRVASSSTEAAAVDSAIAALANSSALAEAVPAEMAVESTIDIAIDTPALSPVAAELAPAAAQDSLRSRVSSMAQAMGSFGSNNTADSVSGTSLTATTAVAQTAAALAVVSMVDVMKQFDGNGSLIASQATSAASLGKTLNLPGLEDPANQGFLALGGK